MKRLIAPVFLLAGCAVDTNFDVVESEAKGRGCPDPMNCDPGNGGGVYTEENGFAGIGPNAYMITHFINNGSSVSLSGRRYNWNTNAFQVGGGTVDGAWYHGAYYSVVSVHENLTKPTWWLRAGNNPAFDVSGDQIVTQSGVQGLQLKLSLDDGTENTYAVAFTSYESESLESVTHNIVTIDKTNVAWKTIGAPMLFQQYCRLANNGGPDTAVYQEGFAVNAVTADFTANPAFVTLSCRQGGPATARLWGYTYGTTVTNRFQAALHMKRASYCGDFTYYTVAGTNIKIYDPVGKQHDISTANYQNIEAVWTNQRAKCVNRNKLRRIGTNPPIGWPAGSPPGPTFEAEQGWCSDINGTHLFQIPQCTAADLNGALLASEASP